MSMTVFKQRLTRNFTPIPNDILNDPKMSWKAKCILCYLLARPPEWTVHLSHLKTVSTDGYDATVSGINELLRNKYLWRRPRGGENPGGWEYYVFQEPCLENPFRDGEIPTRENPESGKPTANKERLEEINKDTEVKANDVHPTENPQGGESARPSCPPDQTQADATTKGRTAGAVIKNPTPNCASPLPELENNKANLNRMFKRRDTTRWSAKELQALEITLGTTDEEWDALLAYYAHAGKEGYFCRNNLITCLNNWAGEIDKARRGKQAVYPKGNESHPSAPKHTPSGHKLSGREEEFWAWLKAWRPYEKRCDIRSVREDYVYDFLNGVVHEPEEPVTEIKLPRVEEDLF
jgi:hypothetical protein